MIKKQNYVQQVILIAIAIVLSLTVFSASAQAACDSDYEKIKAVFEEVYPKNVREKDLESYGEMYTEDALWMPPNAPNRKGKTAIIEGFAATVANQDIDPTFTAEEIQVMGDFGYVIGTSVATVFPHDNQPKKTVTFGALWLMEKQKDEWKISRQIWNNKPTVVPASS